MQYSSTKFDVHVTVHRDKFLKIKPTRCTNFSNLFWKETLHVSDSSSGSAFKQDQDGSWSCLQAVSKPVWHIPLLCVQWKIPDDGQRNCPKHVEFLSKINLRNFASSWFYYKRSSTQFISAQTSTLIILIFLPFVLTTLLLLIMCYYLAAVWDLVTAVFTNTLLVCPYCLRSGHYFRSMVPGYGFQLSLFTISALWPTAVCNSFPSTWL